MIGQIKTLWAYWVFPAFFSLLPWALGFKGLLCIAKKKPAPGEEQAWHNAVKSGFVNEIGRGEWIEHFRLSDLVDLLDGWLLARRSDRWLDRWVDVEGGWPKQGPFLAVTYHWGAGLWSLRHMVKQGCRIRFVVRRVTPEEIKGALGLQKNFKRRVGVIEKLQKNSIIWTEGASAEIQETLKKGISVVIICDVPLRPGWQGIRGKSGEHAFTMSRRFLEIARDLNVPVVPYSMWLDRRSGRRCLEIGLPIAPGDVKHVANELTAYLVKILKRDAAAWRFWFLAESILGETVYKNDAENRCHEEVGRMRGEPCDKLWF